MMDVTSVSHRQDEVFVYGYNDEQEDALNNQLALLMNEQSDEENGDDLTIKIMQLFMMPCAYQPGVQLQHFTVSTLQLYIRFTATIPIIYLPVATPPPLCS